MKTRAASCLSGSAVVIYVAAAKLLLFDNAGRVEHPYSRRDEHFDIFLCRGLTDDLRQLWSNIKKYN